MGVGGELEVSRRDKKNMSGDVEGVAEGREVNNNVKNEVLLPVCMFFFFLGSRIAF